MAKRPRPDPEVIDAPPELLWLHKSQLHVDPAYQREANQTKVEAIARRWSWKALGTLHVARRPDGQYRVFEGGHRLLASKQRTDVQELPCAVYSTRDAIEEAQAFIDTNVRRRTLSSIDRYKAQCVVSDPHATLVRELLDRHGYRVSTAPAEGTRTTKSIGSLIKSARRNRVAFERIFPLLVEIAAGGPLNQKVICAVFYVEHHLDKGQASESLTDEPWRSRLVRLGTQGIVDACSRASAYKGRGGDTVYGLALVDRLNDVHDGNRRKLRLPRVKSALLGSSGEEPGEDEDRAISA